MDLLDDAAYAVVHDFRRGGNKGAPALAPLCNMGVGTLLNKVNPDQPHELKVREAVSIQQAAGDYRILQAEASLLDHVCIRLQRYDHVSDVELLNLYADYHAELGKTATAIAKTLADHRVERAELLAVEKAFFEATRAGLAFLDRLKAIVDD